MALTLCNFLSVSLEQRDVDARHHLAQASVCARCEKSEKNLPPNVAERCYTLGGKRAHYRRREGSFNG